MTMPEYRVSQTGREMFEDQMNKVLDLLNWELGCVNWVIRNRPVAWRANTFQASCMTRF